MGDKLNTAEYDSKGRCVRHSAIRLRKKKIFGGWKIIIGHCPECCLDEMRRVRDEIGAEQDHDNGGDHGEGGGGQHGRKEKKKKKKRSDRHRDKERRTHTRTTANDSISEVGSEGRQRSMEGRHYNNNQGGHHPQSTHPHIDGESEATGSTAQNSSMDGNGSVVSDPYIPRYQQPHHGHGGRDAYYQQPHAHHQQQQPAHPQQQQYHDPHQQQQQQAPPQRTMVLSMAFTDPQTGQRGTYTGQVNSINHKPDGKGTVYYANGSIAEGSWMNGMLADTEDDHGGGFNERGRGGGDNYAGGGGGGVTYPPPPPTSNRSRSTSRARGSVTHDPPHAHAVGAPPRSSRSTSRSNNRGDSAPPANNNPSFSGNLDRLDTLGGGRRGPPPRGASASVQSYNSRGSRQSMPSTSASVQNYGAGVYHSSGTPSVMSGGGGGGGGDPGYNNQFRRGNSVSRQQHQNSQSFNGGQSPQQGYRESF